MSVRSTPTTLKMKIHSSASRPSRSRVRVSSLMRHQTSSPKVGRRKSSRSPASGPEGRGRAPDRQAVAVLEPLARDALAVDEGAVGGVEVADRGHQMGSVGGDTDLAVPPGHSWVVDDDVGALVAAEGGEAAQQRVAVAGDVEPRARRRVGPRDRARDGRLVDGGARAAVRRSRHLLAGAVLAPGLLGGGRPDAEDTRLEALALDERHLEGP